MNQPDRRTKASTPQVTVVIPCFNTASYLPDTLASIRAQTFQDFEVIMVDDASTDETLKVLNGAAALDDRFKVVALTHNQGIVAARNTALAQACGEYVAMLDSDDVWTMDALEVRLKISRQHPTADVIATDFAWFENIPSPSPVGRVGLGPRAQKAFASSFSTCAPILLSDPFELMATTHFAWTGATLVRRDAMAKVGNFDSSFTGPEDTLLWLRLALNGAFVFAPQITAFYRQRPSSFVANLAGPKELHYLRVLESIKIDPAFLPYIKIINRLSAECHHVCSTYYRKLSKYSDATNHALQAFKKQPQIGTYWRSLVGTIIERNFISQKSVH